MATISTYVSGHTETGDVAEFFRKQLLNAGERPIAFFDGVFYESHQERVGNIAYQDYLIYSDRAVYLWARGANKDYLDRFASGAVSINSRNKDNDFATLNLRIRRENKEPVYVIFDMVEIDEADKITTLHTIIESIIENSLGSSFRNEIPDEIAEQIFRSARNICPPNPLSFDSPASRAPRSEQNSRIGYGQDLLEQYKASIGYAPENQSEAELPYGSAPGSRKPQQDSQEPMPPPGIPKGLEGVLPTDPEALKRIAANLRDTIGDAPFKFRDQVMKDLQHIPNDVATMLTAINELISNIADNPKAEKFVMNAIQTAVKNDGILGSMGKMLKLTTSFGPMGKKSPGPPPAARSGGGARSQEPDESLPMPDENSGPIRRKKVKIQADSSDTPLGGVTDSLDQVIQGVGANIPPGPVDSEESKHDGGIQRKKVSVVTEEQPAVPDTGASAETARKDSVLTDTPSLEEHGDDKVQSRKIKVRTEEDDIPQVVEEQLREALQDVADLDLPETGMHGGVEEEKDTSRRKIAIQSEPADKTEPEKNRPRIYKTMESEPVPEDNSSIDTRSQQKKPAANSEPKGPLKKTK